MNVGKDWMLPALRFCQAAALWHHTECRVSFHARIVSVYAKHRSKMHNKDSSLNLKAEAWSFNNTQEIK
jgi:hypothetical protein